MERETLDSILDACVAVYKNDLGEDGQVDFKGKAKAFVRTHSFLASILPYSNADWEKFSIFLNFLIPKLPAVQRQIKCSASNKNPGRIASRKNQLREDGINWRLHPSWTGYSIRPTFLA